MKVLVIHGPNLNLLGTREPETYGTQTLADIDEALGKLATEMEVDLDIHQTPHEGEIIELLHRGIGAVDAALLNPGAYSHTSRAIGDAVRAVPFPVIEVHLSNIHGREPWRRRSVTAEAAAGVVTGFGSLSYSLGLHAVKGLVR